MLRLESQSSVGLRMQPYPRAPDLVWPGHLHGRGCLSARGMDTGLPTVVSCLCSGLGFGVKRLSWLGSWVDVLGYGFWFRPTIPGWGLWCVRLGLGVGLHPALHGWGFWGLPGCVRAPPVPRRSWLGCAVWVCVVGLRFRLRPATPGWGVGVCVCLCVRSACTPPLVAGMCRVCVCAWARVSAARHHSWLGCWGVCVFVCALRLYPATPG